jgi:hypothetical protein
VLDVKPGGAGARSSFHFLPFHPRASAVVCREASAAPTATQESAAAHEIASSDLVALGGPSIVHLFPFHLSIRSALTPERLAT